MAAVAGLAFAEAKVITVTPQINSDFEKRCLSLNTVGKLNLDSLNNDERECLKWLYAYSQMPDLTGYSPEYFIANIRSSLRAKREMPWGAKVPEREFRHFVLPVRINNENFDMHRPQFYEELKDRVKGLSMRDAILEVNHWCHEKVTYQPSDGRTSSPLSSVSQAIGRCGEESTFTVAALRSVGIPARQVYTPRWAHTDDNHAWVEAWADGKWYFLGACEPAPDLNMAWFNSPASRGMLMTTNVIGPYDGPEEKLRVVPLLTTINVTSNYAPVGDIHVVVKDKTGRPVKDATVNFCIYNYAEFFPAASKKSDAQGRASLRSGFGDLVVWATDGKNIGFAKGNPKDQGVLEVVLDKGPDYTGSFDLDIIPPAVSGKLPVASKDAEEACNRRLAYEDSVRKAYVSTFFSEEQAATLAAKLGVDEKKMVKVMTESRGNGKMLQRLFEGLAPAKRDKALTLLCAVSEKDRRDIPAEVIVDNIENTPDSSSPLYASYILNPRVDTEGLVPYKSFFQTQIDPAKVKAYREDPAKFAAWTAENIRIDSEGNPSKLRMDPRAVWKEAKADPRSRNIFFVSAARSMGIPARIDPVTDKTQYANAKGEWVDVDFEARQTVMSPQGVVRLDFKPVGRITDPKYYSQFSICRIDNGVPSQLGFSEGEGLNEIAAEGIRLDEGRYMILSGQRLANGGVLAHGEIFKVEKDRESRRPLVIRQDNNALQVIGSLNAENIYHDIAADADKSILSTTGRGYYVLALLKPSNEPTSHVLNDISLLKDEFEKRGNKLMLLFDNENEWHRFDRGAYKNLPNTAVFGIDNGGASLKEIKESLHLDSDERPIIVVADTFNRIVFVSQGYTIGLGDRLADVLHQVL